MRIEALITCGVSITMVGHGLLSIDEFRRRVRRGAPHRLAFSVCIVGFWPAFLIGDICLGRYLGYDPIHWLHISTLLIVLFIWIAIGKAWLQWFARRYSLVCPHCEISLMGDWMCYRNHTSRGAFVTGVCEDCGEPIIDLDSD